MTDRIARIERTTRESSIVVELNLDGTGRTEISTGVPFFDHMLTAFGQHGSFDLTVQAKGDIEIDAHHTVEDTAIVLGQAFAEALGTRRASAGSATASSRWTRRSRTPRWTSPAGRTRCTPASPTTW